MKILNFYHALKGLLDPKEVKNRCVKGRLDIELAVKSNTKFIFLYTALKYLPSTGFLGPPYAQNTYTC